ncbi:hypothetical protein PUN28_013772 [Cardiocondyla obscurior]|uniref:Uncharacterized protein n=1 Tax=Cardiocondyla obscurior TaxID=286306 RepID=A0AAW2F830_9HYME
MLVIFFDLLIICKALGLYSFLVIILEKKKMNITLIYIKRYIIRSLQLAMCKYCRYNIALIAKIRVEGVQSYYSYLKSIRAKKKKKKKKNTHFQDNHVTKVINQLYFYSPIKNEKETLVRIRDQSAVAI